MDLLRYYPATKEVEFTTAIIDCGRVPDRRPTTFWQGECVWSLCLPGLHICCYDPVFFKFSSWAPNWPLLHCNLDYTSATLHIVLEENRIVFYKGRDHSHWQQFIRSCAPNHRSQLLRFEASLPPLASQYFGGLLSGENQFLLTVRDDDCQAPATSDFRQRSTLTSATPAVIPFLCSSATYALSSVWPNRTRSPPVVHRYSNFKYFTATTSLLCL